LNLPGNRLTALPESIGELTGLTALNLPGNRLTALPESIGRLRGLTELDAAQNELASLPESIGELTGLTTLNLPGNRLTALPWYLADLLTNGLHLNASGNPLEDPLPEIIGRGADALATYLRSLEDAELYYEAKVLMVGEGNVGKTSLVAALSGGPFIEGRPTTHGIEISPLSFRHPIVDVDMTLRAWDFGGQEVYRVTHQFFFSRHALYMVVWNARNGQEQDEVESWIRRIRLRIGNDARVIVVATHCEARLPDLDYLHLKTVFPGMLVGNFEVDSRTGTGVSILREAITKQAAELPYMGQRMSRRWLDAREDILARAESKPQILYQQFSEICERHGMHDQEIMTLAELMHDLGQIIYYGDDEGLRDVVVLNPEWLTKAISYVLEDKPTKEIGGILDHSRLREIWQERLGVPTYPAHYNRYFLRLMEKFDVSYRIYGDELHSLVAQLVPHMRPILPWEYRTHLPRGIRSLSLVCRLSEPAPGLIPWLTVRHHRASRGLHWRRGIFLKHPLASYASEALIELLSTGELIVEVRAPSPDLYFNVLRDSIEDLIFSRWPGLTYEIFITCPGLISDVLMCPGQFPLDVVIGMREDGRNSITCWKCRRDYTVSLLLTGFSMPSQAISNELDQRLTDIEKTLLQVEGHAAEIGSSIRRVLRVVSTEITDCPRLFTIFSEKPIGRKRLRIDQRHLRLTLWCEHPGYWHPWAPASYDLNQPVEWFAEVSPYVRLILKTLQLVVPLVEPLTDMLLSPQQLAHAQKELKLMSAFVADLPRELQSKQTNLGTSGPRQLTAAEGQALRAIRAILFEQDRLRAFGGLRRVQEPSGDFLWVCEAHYPEYDPGLPEVP
jgi:hypothetical protein